MLVLITYEISIKDRQDLDQEPDEFMMCIAYPRTMFTKEVLELLQPDWMNQRLGLNNKKPKKVQKMSLSEDATKNFKLIQGTELPIEVRLGKTSKPLQDVLKIGEGTILSLDKLAGEAVDVFVNGVLFAKGEVVVIDENFGVRVTEVLGDQDGTSE